MLYKFTDQLATGIEGEEELDSYFSQYYHIYPATPEQQHQGIDRIFVCLVRRTAWAIEYKTDEKASTTGNAFIETISVDTSEGQTFRPGWLHTSQCHYLVYYLPQQRRIYLLTPERIRQKVEGGWAEQYPRATARNKGYKTHGLLVPLEEIKKISEKILNMGAK